MIKWWNDVDIEIVKIDDRYIALYGWNGEKYTDCWEVEKIINNTAFGVKEENIQVRCIYDKINNSVYEVNGYEII